MQKIAKFAALYKIVSLYLKYFVFYEQCDQKKSPNVYKSSLKNDFTRKW